MTIKAIYENGVFRPLMPVNLPDKAEVDVTLSTKLPDAADDAKREEGRKEIMKILSRRYRTGRSDLAARHNEHQP